MLSRHPNFLNLKLKLAHRFPEDFMFQLTAEEAAALRSQIAMSKGGDPVRHFRNLPAKADDGNSSTDIPASLTIPPIPFLASWVPD
jgi:ORF6N domain